MTATVESETQALTLSSLRLLVSPVDSSQVARRAGMLFFACASSGTLVERMYRMSYSLT